MCGSFCRCMDLVLEGRYALWHALKITSLVLKISGTVAGDHLGRYLLPLAVREVCQVLFMSRWVLALSSQPFLCMNYIWSISCLCSSTKFITCTACTCILCQRWVGSSLYMQSPVLNCGMQSTEFLACMMSKRWCYANVYVLESRKCERYAVQNVLHL